MENVITVSRTLDELKAQVTAIASDCSLLQSNKSDASKLASDAIKAYKTSLEDTVKEVKAITDPLPVLISLIRDINGGGSAAERMRAGRQRKLIAEAANAVLAFQHNGFTYNVELVNLGSAKAPAFTLEYVESTAIPAYEELQAHFEDHCKSKKYSLEVQYIALQELMEIVKNKYYAAEDARLRKSKAIATQKVQTSYPTDTDTDDSDIV